MDSNNYGMYRCKKCNEYIITYEEDKDDYEVCGCKESKKIFTPHNRVKTPEFFLTCIKMDLEGANHHSQIGIANDIYRQITKKLILDEKQKLNISKILYKCFYDSI